ENGTNGDQRIQDGYRLAMRSAHSLVKLENLDVIVEATGVPEVGAFVCEAAILNHKHIVNMNVEADATIGYYLTQLADQHNVVYSLAAGDEPGSIKEIYDFADALGFEIVAIGKGKNNPLNRASNPDTTATKAERQKMSAKMLASFEDGTKTMVEMTSIANAIGYPPDIRGAHGPNVNVNQLADTFIPQTDGGIFSGAGKVDYAVGDVAPGVFVIITTDQPKIIRDLNYLRLNGNGKYWAFYRPYHLANLETPITIANVVLDQRATLRQDRAPVAETIATAKRDLVPGEKIDALGGYTVYGMIEKAEIVHRDGILPLGLAVGATIERPVKMGDPIRYDDVSLEATSNITRLRRKQDQLIGIQSSVSS
ncbi:MAG: SAF domain-containing protein, partial [Chloroflexota bacterium]